jgi:hypothetical protein
MIGILNRDSSANFWNLSAISAQSDDTSFADVALIVTEFVDSLENHEPVRANRFAVLLRTGSR